MADIELDKMIAMVCSSKAEEFRLIGYEHVTAEEIWECASASYAKKGQPALHQIVNDILSLKADRFMNFLLLGAMKGTMFK